MKFYFLLFFSLFSISLIQAQETSNEIKNHELKLNIGYALSDFPEISYEYILNEENSLGISVAVGDFEGFDDDFKFALTPYFRWFFGKKRAAGFFAETFGMLNVAENDYLFNPDDNTGEKGTGFAFGIAIGGKWITSNNWIFELYSGYGRNLINDDITSDVMRGGLSIGKRF